MLVAQPSRGVFPIIVSRAVDSGGPAGIQHYILAGWPVLRSHNRSGACYMHRWPSGARDKVYRLDQKRHASYGPASRGDMQHLDGVLTHYSSGLG